MHAARYLEQYDPEQDYMNFTAPGAYSYIVRI